MPGRSDHNIKMFVQAFLTGMLVPSGLFACLIGAVENIFGIMGPLLGSGARRE